ncbi:MAG: SDR family oxidoreductase [Saprospiraceae bacterium]
MLNYYHQKIIWITGASSGIGQALAVEANVRGATIILSGRNEIKLAETQDKLKYPMESIILPMDICDELSIQLALSQVQQKVKKIDILINNAGVSQRSLILDTDIEVYRNLMEVNYFGVINLTKKVLPSMISHHSGQIVVMSSLAGKFGAPLRSGYSAAKHALHGFFDCLRIEHFKDGIKVNLICSGFTKTNIALNALNAKGIANHKNDREIDMGMDPIDLSKKILDAVENNIHESYFGGKEVLSVYLKRFFPKILFKILSKRNSSN